MRASKARTEMESHNYYAGGRGFSSLRREACAKPVLQPPPRHTHDAQGRQCTLSQPPFHNSHHLLGTQAAQSHLGQPRLTPQWPTRQSLRACASHLSTRGRQRDSAAHLMQHRPAESEQCAHISVMLASKGWVVLCSCQEMPSHTLKKCLCVRACKMQVSG